MTQQNSNHIEVKVVDGVPTPITTGNVVDEEVEYGGGYSILDQSRRNSLASLQHTMHHEETEPNREPWTTKSILRTIFLILCFLTSLWIFMIGLKVMGDAFKTIAGCEAGTLFDFVNNPIAGLMVGILCTVLVQSSSTTTSIVVSLVASGGMTVRQAVPVIMGANIGTTVTSTLVAMGQIADREQFRRAFSAATVHDMFNLLSVIILLPIEVISHVLEEITSSMVGSGTASEGNKMKSPLDPIVKPIAKLFLQVDKKLIEKAAKGDVKCSEVDSILKGGMFHGNTSDTVAGSISLIISLILVVGSLLAIVKLLNILLMSTAEKTIKKALHLNGYIMMIIGAGITFLVQSSSIITSVLTPLVGVGLIDIKKMFPMVLGANIGTTGTAFLASMVSGKDEAVQIALCHLFFNIFGILIWYPIRPMRRIPIRMAKSMGWAASCAKWVPLAYIVTMFAIIPALLLGLSYSFEGSTAAIVCGAIATGALVIMIIAFIIWYVKVGGKDRLIAFFENQAVKSTGSSDDRRTDSFVETPKQDNLGSNYVRSHHV